MKIKTLRLKNYRNCRNINLDFESQKTLIIGKNAQGKTNILESIYFLSDLKSPRTSTLTDLIKIGENKFEINATVEKNETEIELDYSYTEEKKREILVNKVKTTPKNFKTVVKTILFSTKDLLLLRGSPQDRRDWLDRAISQIYPAYDERLSKYDKIRIQKNNLLKQEVIDESLFDIYNEQLVVTGANIIFLRKKFLREIESIAAKKHKTISNTEDFSIKYTFPLGAHDIDTLQGDMELRFTTTGDTFNPLGEDVIETLENNEVAYVSNHIVKTRRYIARQDKIESKMNLVFIECRNEVASVEVELVVYI